MEIENAEVDELSSLLADYADKKTTARKTGETTRTVDRNINGPNGIRTMKIGGKVWIHQGDYAEMLKRRITRRNPVREAG